MDKPFVEIDAANFFIQAFEVKPPAGYEPPANPETKEQLPNCCPFHKGVYDEAVKWFEKFPNCCAIHKEYDGKWWFLKDNYNGIADKIIKQLSYTEYHISKQIDSPNWYKEITDYIEYNVTSFGQPAVGLHLYLDKVKKLIKKPKGDLTQGELSKVKKLTEFIDKYSITEETVTEANQPSKTLFQSELPHRIDISEPTATSTDLNVLYKVYQDWLRIFPFELSFFSPLKQHFENQLPILNSVPEVNKYSGFAKAKLHTKGSLFEALISLTDNLLTQINGLKLYEKGLITDANKIKLELIINNRKLELQQGYKNSSPNEEHRYRKMLKKWYADEKRFIDELIPILKPAPPKQTETKADKLKIVFGKYGFFDLPMVKQLTAENKEKLVELISSNELPYCIAMFDYLGFLKHLEKNHLQTKYKLNKEIGKWLNSDKDGRAVKGNISSLLKNTTENKERYTAHLHKETVQNDYQKLK